jgi:hypothetical protein
MQKSNPLGKTYWSQRLVILGVILAITISTLGKPKLWVPMPDNSRLNLAYLQYRLVSVPLRL